MPTRIFTVGDRLISLLANLYKLDGSPLILAATDTVTFRMVEKDAGTVKVNNAAATIVSRGSATTGTPAQVRYDWLAADVDTAGTYAGWFIRSSLAGLAEHFPHQDHSEPEFEIIFRADT